MQSAATKQETIQLFPSQWIYAYSIYTEEGNPDRSGEASVQQPLHQHIQTTQGLKFKVIQTAHLQYIYTPFRNSDVCLATFFSLLIPRFWCFVCLLVWPWFCFLKGHLIMVLFRSFTLKSKLNSSSNRRLNCFVLLNCSILIKNLSFNAKPLL